MMTLSIADSVLRHQLLLIDDDEDMTQMLAEYLSLDRYDVSVAHDGRAADLLLSQRDFDVILLDLMLPGVNGLDILRRYRQRSLRPVIMFSAHGDETDRVLGLEGGADDYLVKPFGPRELKARIQAILRRAAQQSAAPQGILTLGPLNHTPATGETCWDDRAVALTGAEQRILALLMRSQERIVSREELGQYALGRAPSAYDRSVETHIYSIRRKLGIDAEASPIVLRNLRGQGYILALRQVQAG